jgi:hypothetical protein
MKLDTRVLIVACLIVAGGLVFQTLPAPRPKPERPVLKFLAKVAKLGLWLMVVRDEPAPPTYAIDTHLVDEHGQRVLANREGW